MSNVYKIPYERSFASHEKAKFWHPAMNGNVVPRGVAKSANKKFWFSCDTCKHSFYSSINNITNKNNLRWCPYCSNQKLCMDELCQMCFNNSFASHEKSKYWHPTKNGVVGPRNVFKSSNKKYWFYCDTCKHDFNSSPAIITGQGHWCSYCAHQKLCDDEKCNMCFENSFASHEKAKFWHPTMNGDVVPRGVAKSTHKKFWFSCDTCKHNIYISLSNIVWGCWCSFCSHKLLCDDEKCNMCFENSFASHEKAKYWHPTKNGDITPRQIFKSTSKKYWFSCDYCKHDFHSSPETISGTGSWCSYCAHLKLCQDNNCKMCFDNSFASHEKAKFWHPTKNGDITPRQIFKSTHKKYWFSCDDCKHDFHSSSAIITRLGSWCSFCSHKLLCDDEKCNMCFENSFASHKKAAFWHPTKNGDITPRQVFKSTGKKYLFSCDTCKRDFHSSPNKITGPGRWCPHCVNKTEAKMKDHLEREKENLYIKSIKHHYRPKWTKVHGTSYEYDFYIELTNGVKIIIEIDGRQHYEQVSNWQTPLYNQIRDCIKERLAGNQEINLIRLNQEAIWEDKRNWQQILDSFIRKKYVNNNEIEIYDTCQW